MVMTLPALPVPLAPVATLYYDMAAIMFHHTKKVMHENSCDFFILISVTKFLKIVEIKILGAGLV
jgi:hypothetical protein